MKPLKGTATSRRKALAALAALYADMDAAYARASSALGLSCRACDDNCCPSHFQHHTRVEWLYLFEGLGGLDAAERRTLAKRAEANVAGCREALAAGQTPRVMCPLNEDGLCRLYAHRFMICRLHGVPNVLFTPRGAMEFPGCAKAQALVAAGRGEAAMDRTPLYRRLAAIEMDLLGPARTRLPKVDMTLSEMLLAGPPTW